MASLFLSTASPVHIVALVPPQLSQPSKVPSLFPKHGSPAGTLLMQQMNSLQTTRDSKLPTAPEPGTPPSYLHSSGEDSEKLGDEAAVCFITTA